jgi:hypothetical protein
MQCLIGNKYSEMKTNKSLEMKTNFFGNERFFLNSEMNNHFSEMKCIDYAGVALQRGY